MSKSNKIYLEYCQVTLAFSKNGFLFDFFVDLTPSPRILEIPSYNNKKSKDKRINPSILARVLRFLYYDVMDVREGFL